MVVDLGGVHTIRDRVLDGQRVEIEWVFEDGSVVLRTDVEVEPEETAFVREGPANHFAVARLC
jgi:hypothetical protein